jgi:ArsR family transcriptional regulator, lead/cadmium/zinc/bismuth-responsive transcriptional repressor
MVAHCSTRVIHPEAVEAARARLPAPEELAGMETLFKALGDSTRLRILHALLAGEMCVCDLSETLRMSVSAVSHQLAGLKAAHLVSNRRQGKIVYYTLSDHHVSQVLQAMRVHLAE